MVQYYEKIVVFIQILLKLRQNVLRERWYLGPGGSTEQVCLVFLVPYSKISHHWLEL